MMSMLILVALVVGKACVSHLGDLFWQQNGVLRGKPTSTNLGQE